MSGASRILVCGGRDFEDKNSMDYVLGEAQKYWFAPQFCIIQGGAKGADAMAKAWAMYRGICCITVDANWDFHGNRAGPIRNSWMLHYCNPDFVIVFPGGTGTADMYKQARKIPHLPVFQAEP